MEKETSVGVNGRIAWVGEGLLATTAKSEMIGSLNNWERSRAGKLHSHLGGGPGWGKKKVVTTGEGGT